MCIDLLIHSLRFKYINTCDGDIGEILFKFTTEKAVASEL